MRLTGSTRGGFVRRGHAILVASIGLGLVGAAPAVAAGGAHVVDDAEVEAAGVCHLESWATGYSRAGGLVNAAPGCTFRDLPSTEFGVSVLHGWSGGDSWTMVAPAVKLAMRRVDRGFGLGLAVTAAMDAGSGRFETAAVVVPLTFDVSTNVRMNLNAGYHWSRSGDRHVAFMGVQADWRASPTIALMGEVFARDSSSQPGWQAGLRWTPREWIDLDLLGGRRVDGTASHAFTLGLTLRR